MIKNPYLNAVFATIYITLVSLFMYFGSKFIKIDNKILSPIAFMSLLTLSVAVMGYLFVLEPLQMYLSGEKTKSVHFFLKTLATFACITLLVIVLIFLRVF